VLHGREHERALLTDLLDRARAGTAGALVIRGDAGVGKSALVDAVLDDASVAGMQVLKSQGMESESPLAFAGLHQLLRPLLGFLDELPAPQSRALRVAFGEQEGATVDRFVTALATLSLLTRAAENKAVVCVIDDAHWLDAATSEALLFVMRRLQADPVALIFTARDSDGLTFIADGVPSLNLSGLDAASGRALLDDQFGAGLADDVAAALLEQTGGNPLALVELPTALTNDQLAGSAPLPAQLHLTDRLQRVFLDRCRRLPEQVQTLLLVAAADDTGNLSVVQQAAAHLGVTADALQEAERAKLLVTDRDSLRLRHPLVRSALYQSATGQARRTTHQALAIALGDTHPDRQAWHLAASIDGPEPDVADALQRTAQRAERAGGYAAAAAAYERAAELSTTDPQRAERLFAAARNAWGSGKAERGRRLADAARGLAEDRIVRADIDRLRARIEINVGSAATAHHIFTTAARAVEADDPVRALEMRVAATLTHLFNAEVPQPRDRLPSDAELPTDPRTRCLRQLLAAMTADEAQRWGDALAPLAEALETSAEVDDPDVVANVGNAALHMGDDEGHRRSFTRMLAGSRDRDAVMAVLYALPRLAFADLVAGHWDRVRAAADEAITLAAATGQQPLAAPSLAWRVLLAALRGDDGAYDELRPRLDAAQREHLGVLTDPVHDMSRWSAGIRLMHAGEASSALDQLSRMRVTPLARMAALDRIDAALRADEPAQATTWIEDLAGFAAATGWAWASAAVAYGRALLAAPADAPGWFEIALAHYARAQRPYERARTHLAYGELLRRSQRRLDARPHLRAALAVFEEIGAAPLATRAAQELRASGETARKRDPSTLTALTPMELQVVQLVGEGRSNKEVAAHLFISPRTVAFHLRGAFAKLGISSRGELTRLDLPTPRVPVGVAAEPIDH
jgi:DNA-binding CsgD family transcriptional regulator